jgi:hypothetical protein
MLSARVLLFAAVSAALAFAQSSPATCNSATVPVCSKGSPSGDVQIKPQAVPSSSTVVTKVDAYLKTITVTNTTSGAVTFTLQDGQGSPIAVLSAVSVAANTTYVIVFPALYWCPGGFTVQASSTGLNFYGAWRQ